MRITRYIIFCSTLLFFIKTGTSQNFGLDSLSSWQRPGLPTIDWQAYSDIWGWHDGKGREYAIMGSLDSIYFIEVTDPKKPVLRAAEAGRAQNVIHRDFKTYKNYCYAVGDEGNSSLQIFDLSYLPDSVVKVYDADKLLLRTHNIFIDGDRLYLGTCRLRTGSIVPMRILSIKDPENPTLLLDVYGPDLGGSKLFYEVHDMFAKNDTVYCSTGSDGLFTFKFSDTTVYSNTDSTWVVKEPKIELLNWGTLVSYPSKGYNHSSWLSNNSKYLVMADETPGTKLKLINFSWNDIPEVVSTFGSAHAQGSLPHNPFIHKKRIYVAYYHEGVVVFDMHNPDEVKMVAKFDTYPDNIDFKGMYGCWGVYPYLPSGNIIASDQLYGLFVLNFSVGEKELENVGEKPQVFPNPTQSGSFQINFATGAKKLKKIALYTANGSKVFETETYENTYLFNNSLSLKKGLYIVEMTCDDQFWTSKLILD